ncbi:MAG: low molecular weight protein-tyrosine-phosphatase [Bacteroidales bacterium]
MSTKKTKILILCHGNICRSTMAEGILKHKFIQQSKNVIVESAGFEAFHIGDEPDKRTIETLRNHQITLSGKKARLFTTEDFDNFDKIYFMDDNNFHHVKAFVRSKEDLAKLDYIMNVVELKLNLQVPDPYYGGKEGFEKVYQMLDKACNVISELYS